MVEMKKVQFSSSEADKQLLELAIWTRNWMRQMKAYIDEETAAHGYVTVDEWREVSGRSNFEWSQVKREMIRLGIPLLYDSYGGHYIGEPGQQAKNAVQLVKRAQTMMETALLYLQYMRQSDQWDQCKDVFENGLSDRDLSIDKLSDALTGFTRIDGGFDQLLLNGE